MLARLGRWLYDSPYVLLCLMPLFWAGNQVLGRAVAGEIPPVAYSFLRWAGATLITLPFAVAHVRRDWPVMRQHLVYLTLIGVVGGGLFNTLQYIGLNYTTALNSLVLNSAAPIFIAVACFVIFKERITVVQMLGTGLSMSGVLAVVSGGSLEALAGLTFNKGDLIILAAMAATSVYTAFLRLRPKIHWVSFLFSMFLSSTLFIVPFLAWELASGARMVVSTFTLSAVAYVAIFPSIIAYICFTRGVELVGGVRAGIFMHLIPLFGAVLAIGLLGEPLGLHHIVGFMLILAGVALASRRP